MSKNVDGGLSGAGRVAGVIGWPVSHSLSPRLHGYWLRIYDIDGAYVPMAVQPKAIATAIRGMAALGMQGANITLPHKEEVLRLVDTVDETARRIGAVNTVTVETTGKLTGRNTDAFGFVHNLINGCDGWNPKAGPAVILGAGGAARAVIVALLDAGVPEIKLVNRSLERAELIASEFGSAISPCKWAARSEILVDAGLLVNTTSLGMVGAPPLDLNLARLPLSAVVNDIVYSPLETSLLAAARARGNPTIDGLGMLLHQAVPGFAAWFGVTPEVTPELRAHVLAAGD